MESVEAINQPCSIDGQYWFILQWQLLCISQESCNGKIRLSWFWQGREFRFLSFNLKLFEHLYMQ